MLWHLADGRYGGRFPVTAAGWGVGSVLVVIGVAVFGVVTATIAAYCLEIVTPSSLGEIAAQRDHVEAALGRVPAGADVPDRRERR